MPRRSPVTAAGRRATLAVALALVAGVPAIAQPPGRPTPSPREAPAPGQVLSLADAIALGLRQNPTIRAAQEGRTAAVARVPQARAAYFPRIDWVTSFDRRQVVTTTRRDTPTPTSIDPVTGEPIPGVAPPAGVDGDTTVQANNFNTALQGRQLIFDFGKTAAVVDEAKAGVKLSEGELERIRELVVLIVRQAYYQLLQARRLVAVADAQVARAELNLRSARGFFEVGTRAKSDVTRAEVEVANAQVAQIRARNNIRLAETNLANALGLDATTPIAVEDVLGFEPVALDAQLLLAEALTNRPELVQAVARLEAARAQLAGARARFLPDLNAVGSFGGTGEDLSLNETWSVGVALTWNLFEGLFSVYRVRETQALVEAARANYETLELQVRLEVEQAAIAVIEAAERIGATTKAVESAQENLRLAQGRYDAGVGTILDLTTAQLDLTNAEADLIRALTDHKLGLALVDRAVGRP